ncbi:hypothetical protein JHS95_23575 [Vibrio parahaemolyticus]|uniref:hypothetical protein n=1 Tax=Vibrio parahaemolyticus TaxID=670 RepID=UPI001B83799D|nr:hypothetical protein [Vibrio parahaemolyticus]UJW96472.1 hypothetical protein JHS95_23575 [Vibrio parahaemolyticus]HBB9944285.1 hypothetical protein [Vibrio parahaemolyticus]HBC3416756.1 hypothetical protein [Vibrio parahaemolyticus]HBC3602238.1 hypothetical protein [Vibrio parahaemolyticus]HBC3878308.1 hypothetical protein [Vibrio parahaemolyticus]
MKLSKHPYHNIISNISFIEFLVALSLFIAVCGIQLTNELAAFEAVHFVVAGLFSIPLYLFRRWAYKRQPQPSTMLTTLLLTIAISLLFLIEAHTPLKMINTLCFALLMFAVVTPPNKQGE